MEIRAALLGWRLPSAVVNFQKFTPESPLQQLDYGAVTEGVGNQPCCLSLAAPVIAPVDPAY